MIEIGDITIPIVFAIDTLDTRPVDEISSLNSYDSTIDQTAVLHDASPTTISIGGYLNKELHPDEIEIGEQKKELKLLRSRKILDNPINYKQYKGYLLVEEVDFLDNADSSIVDEAVITCRYFPWPKFYPDDEPS